MIPDEIQKQIHAAMSKMGKRLVDNGFAEDFTMSEIPGKGGMRLTDSGMVLASALRKIFGDVANEPHKLNGIEVVALAQLILASRPLSDN